jgi:4-hydroxybenzoate-CoA ligase
VERAARGLLEAAADDEPSAVSLAPPRAACSTRPVEPTPHPFNASSIVDGNLERGFADRIALIEADGARRKITYRELARRMNRAGNALKSLGLEIEQRVLMCMLDTIDFPPMFFGAMKMGAVPIPVNTLLTSQEYDFMLRDSRARILVVSGALFSKFQPILSNQPFLRAIIISDPPAGMNPSAERMHDLSALLDDASEALEPFATTSDDIAFWLYSSGSTGRPKGAVHLHAHISRTAELFGRGILEMKEDDVVFSAAKLFFAYGLGNGMSFPFSAGASTVLLSDRPTPPIVLRILKEHAPTIYFGVPTLYASILADPGSREAAPGGARLRACVSAGEALPEGLEARWRERFGVHIIDGLGSTEMLHIFLSDGRPVRGYEVMIVDENDRPLPQGEIGELKVSGPTAAAFYWNQREKSRLTFRGRWTFTGDKYVLREDGRYLYCGRSDDMIKVGGIWVSPAEVEAALAAHEKVLEAAVVGVPDDNGLVKPMAFVVTKPGQFGSPALETELKDFVKSKLAPYKYPRTIEFLDALPKTATGKIQRFKLRQRSG